MKFQNIIKCIVIITTYLRDYMANIWGNLRIAVMGAGREVWPKIYFLVHMTMSTGPLASPPPRGGDSRRLQIFA